MCVCVCVCVCWRASGYLGRYTDRCLECLDTDTRDFRLHDPHMIACGHKHIHIGRPVCLYTPAQTNSQKDFMSPLLAIWLCVLVCVRIRMCPRWKKCCWGDAEAQGVVWHQNVCTWCTWVCPRGCVRVCVCSCLRECVYVLKIPCFTGLCVY